MKNTTKAKTCLLALMLPATSYAQNHYDWTMSDDVAHWGSPPSVLNPSEGSYTQDSINWFGNNMGVSNIVPAFHGPYDGVSGMISGTNSTGIATRTDSDAIFDLSAVGSSATIRTAYNYFNTNKPINNPNGHAHAYQFGLTNNASYFGKAGNESLLLAADLTGYDAAAHAITVDLDILDHTGLDTTNDVNWVTNPLIDNLASGLSIQSGSKRGLLSGEMGIPQAGNSHAIELTYTNLGEGKLKLDVGVINMNISGSLPSDTVTSTNQIVQNSYVIDHNFSDLSALRPGFGFALHDNFTPIGSGVNFDWEDAYPTGFSVPEPSSVSLLGLGIAGFLLRRKRK